MRILITGGAGFIGSNAVKRFTEAGWEVTIMDDLSRKGAKKNLDWLDSLSIPYQHQNIDISRNNLVEPFLNKNTFDVILHLAAQVAVTTSVTNPRRDFEINAIGTFNLLESIRKFNPDTIFINISTNKVYGKLQDFPVKELATCYDFPENRTGISEKTPVDYYSPYGCSKGIADQYSIDYHRIYGIKSVTLRQSCIYGERQFGIEDQGWVAWFIIAHLLGKDITIYGNGKQGRDILYVDDLIDAYFKVIENIDNAAGQAFNIGGGQHNNTSLLEFIQLVEKYSEDKIQYTFSDWRPGDQPLFISDIKKAEEVLKWFPKTEMNKGIKKIFTWVKSNLELFD